MIGQPDIIFSTQGTYRLRWIYFFSRQEFVIGENSCLVAVLDFIDPEKQVILCSSSIVCYQIFVILFPDDTTPQFLRKLNRSFDYRYNPVHKGKAQGYQRLLFQTLGWHANRLKRYKYLHNFSDQDVSTLCTTGLSWTRLNKNFCHWIHRSSITSHRN